MKEIWKKNKMNRQKTRKKIKTSKIHCFCQSWWIITKPIHRQYGEYIYKSPKSSEILGNLSQYPTYKGPDNTVNFILVWNFSAVGGLRFCCNYMNFSLGAIEKYVVGGEEGNKIKMKRFHSNPFFFSCAGSFFSCAESFGHRKSHFEVGIKDWW